MKNIFKKTIWGLLLGFSLTAFGQTEEKVVFSAPGGFYETSLSLSLQCLSDLHHVRYTTNGTTPNANSCLYESPIWLDRSQFSRSNIYTILTSPEDLFYLPDSVQHCIVIRAAVFDQNDSCVSKTFTQSYLIRDISIDTQLGMISLCADSLDLFDFNTGIMVPGVYWDSASPHGTGNYFQRGIEWERMVNVEFYEPNDTTYINQCCGLRTHGNISRIFQGKGLKIYAREEYGKKRFKHKFFDNSPVDSFKHLILKTFAVFWPNAGTTNYISSEMALQMGLESAHSRPVVVFLNGEYWGIYFLMEKTDERYLEDYFGIDIENCNIIENWYGKIDCGSNTNFLQMMQWLDKTDLSIPENYAEICELIDMDNFIDYMILETYIGNWDWPGNNMRCWQIGNGPWRWFFFDGDYAFIHEDFKAFENATYTGPWTGSNNVQATLLFRKLLNNQQFLERFSSRLQELCRGLLQYDSINPIVQPILQILEPEVASQTDRFGYPSSMNMWNYGNSIVDNYLQNRTEVYLAEFNEFIQNLIGIPEIPTQQLVCYPNPAKDNITVMFRDSFLPEGRTEYQITNLMGQTVLSDVLGSQTIDVSSLSDGLYILRIEGQTIKFIVQKGS